MNTTSATSLEQLIAHNPLYQIITNNRLHVLLTVVGLIGLVFAIEHLPYSPAVMSAVVSLIYGSYVLNIAFDRIEDETNYGPHYQVFWRSTWATAIAILVLMGFPLALAISHTPETTLITLLVMVPASMYSIPFLHGGGSGPRRIKDIPLLKNSACALVWGAAVVLLPHVFLNVPLSSTSWALFSLLVAMNFYVEVLWDLRDIDGDRKTGRMHSLPMLLGKQHTLSLLQALNATIMLMTLWFVHTGWIPRLFLVYASLGIYNIFFITGYLKGDTTVKSHIYVMTNAAMVCIFAAIESGLAG